MEDRLSTSLILLCAASTSSARTGGFPAPDEPLDEAGRRAAAGCPLPERFRVTVMASPSRAALETASAMGLSVHEEKALMDVDHGLWSGRAFSEIAPEALAIWLADPSSGAPGGESLAAARHRVGVWLDGIATAGKPVCAITHATMIRAALAHTLDLTLPATLRIDIAPLSRVLLSFNRFWRLQAIGPFD